MSISWTQPSVTLGGVVVNDVCWADTLNLFVAVGQASTPTTACVFTSPDGTTWTTRTASQANNWRAIAWSHSLSLLVAVSNNGTNRVMTSPDGINWTNRTQATNLFGVAWSPTLNLFAAVGSNNIQTSPDGVNWTTRTPINKSWHTVCWGNGLFVAAATDSGTASVMSSADGITWTGRTTPTWVSGVVNSGSALSCWGSFAAKFCVAVRTDSPNVGNYQFFTSPDAVTWTAQNSATSGSTAAPFCVLADTTNNQFLSVGFGDCYSSPDGVSWTRTATALGSFFSGSQPIASNASVIVAFDSAGSNSVMVGTFGPAGGLSPATDLGSGGVTVTITHVGSYPAFRPAGSYLVIFGNTPFPVDYDPVVGYAPFGEPYMANAPGTYVSPTQITCIAPPYFNTNGPVDVVVVDQNPTGLAHDPVTGFPLNISFYLPAAWSWKQPTIVSIAPGTGGGGGGTPFTVTGINLYPGVAGFTAQVSNYIRFGKNKVPTTFVNSTTLTGASAPYSGDVVVDVTLIPPLLPVPLFDQNRTQQAPTTLIGAWTYTKVWWLSLPDFDFTYFSPDTCLYIFGDYKTFLALYALYFGEPFESVIPICANSGEPWDFQGIGHYTYQWWHLNYDPPGPPNWRYPGVAPDPNGWWSSVSGFRGDVMVVAGVAGDNSAVRPQSPRSWTDFAAFASGTAAFLGGSPGIAVTIRNRVVYAASNYSGTAPPIRIFDGSYDRQLTTVPPAIGGGVPKAIVSMFAANGRIYVATLDAGTSSSDFVGRVFALDIESAALTPIGAPFPAGHVPYALAWCNGFLWCGTHRQVSTAIGKVFSIRPDIDSAWVADYDLTGSGVAGVSALASFQGSLYVGTTAAAGTFAKILRRNPAGTYTTVDTMSGGTATANNGYLSMKEFKGSLYAGYWNNDTPPVAAIRVSGDGTTWVSPAGSGTATPHRPILVLGVDDGTLFAIGGGPSLAIQLLSTQDGALWTDLTPQIPDTTETAVPAFGVVVL
jgi:hypothetical protein